LRSNKHSAILEISLTARRGKWYTVTRPVIGEGEEIMTENTDQRFPRQGGSPRKPRQQDQIFYMRPWDGPAFHALVIGVSYYRHLPGGGGRKTTSTLAKGLGQLSAAATSALSVACWIRDNYDPPDVSGGSIRLLLSPSPKEDIAKHIPHNTLVRSATYAHVRAAVNTWRRDLRSNASNIALLYIAGHGIQRTREGGIILLEDFGDENALTPLTGAIDVESVRNGVVADRTQAGTYTPNRQFYFYDACRVELNDDEKFEKLDAGITLDAPKGKLADVSWVSFGSRSGDYAIADAANHYTLYSKAFVDCLDTRAEVDTDGRTVRVGPFQTALEEYLPTLAESLGEDQQAIPGGWGQLITPIHRRARLAPPTSGKTQPVQVDVRPHVPVVARVNGMVMGEWGASRQPIQLPVGSGYEAVVPLPWGGEHVTPFDVPETTDGDVAVQIRLDPVELDRVRAVADETSAAPSDVAYAADEGYWALRFLQWHAGSFEIAETPKIVGYERLTTGDIRLTVSLERLGFGALDHDAGVAPPLVQIESEGGRSPLTVLPLSGGSSLRCEVIVSIRDGGARITVHPDSWRAYVAGGYLNSGRADRAVMAMQRGPATVAQDAVTDPIAAVTASYALLKLNDLQQIRGRCDAFADEYPSLPDAPVIAGVVAARLRKPQTALRWFRAAAERGIPIFSEGLSLLVAETQAQGRVQDLGAIADLALRADFSSLYTTLHTAPQEEVQGWIHVGPEVNDRSADMGLYEGWAPTTLPDDAMQVDSTDLPPEMNAYE
jgi:hypothetical protein